MHAQLPAFSPPLLVNRFAACLTVNRRLQEIRDHITDEHLLQFAAVAGEEAARAAARELALPAAWAAPGSLLGPCDASAACSDERWERVIERSEGGLSYEVWRQELRGGLYMYRSRALFAGVSPKDLRPFHLDDHARWVACRVPHIAAVVPRCCCCWVGTANIPWRHLHPSPPATPASHPHLPPS